MSPPGQDPTVKGHDMTLPSEQVYINLDVSKISNFPSEKVCSVCGELKPLNDFEKNANGRFGRHSQCRKCRASHIPGTPRKSYYVETPESRFWKYVNKTEGCWIWNGPCTYARYGTLRIHGTHVAAHRFSWELHNGPIQNGLYVCHHCDNPPCVNPDHLFLGTNKDNVDDMWNKGRGVMCPPSIGVNNVNAKLTDADIPIIRDLLSDHSITQNSIAELFHVTRKAIWQIRNGKTWTHVK